MKTELQKGFPTCSKEQVISIMEKGFDDNKTEIYWPSFRNNLNNSWNVNSNGNLNNNNSYNSYVIMPVIDLCDLLISSEEKCWKNKHSSVEATTYHFHLAQLIDLANDLVSGTYKPLTASCFVIAYPVWREIFAALYRDRIVHHLVAPLIEAVAEPIHISNGNISYGNRKKYSVQRASEDIRDIIKEMSNNYTRDVYVSTNDFSGFFMSLDRKKVFETFKSFEKEIDLKIPHKEFLLSILEILVLHDPLSNYIKTSPEKSWNNVPHRKSLLYSKKGCGLPIGNFYSQLLANLFLAILDRELALLSNIKAVRFVDDIFICSITAKEALEVRKCIIRTASELGLKISTNKFYIQKYSKGVRFCGRIIKYNRIYVLYRTLHRCKHKIPYIKNNIEKLRSVINSYFGLFSKCSMYKILKLLCINILKRIHGIYFERKNKQLILKRNEVRKIY